MKIIATFTIYNMRENYDERFDLRPQYDWWCAHFKINKFADGTYETELDEMESFGTSTSHCGGGVIHRTIPQDYFDLQYDEFLEKVIALAGARKYNFTIDDLKDKEGLEEFFNQNRDI